MGVIPEYGNEIKNLKIKMQIKLTAHLSMTVLLPGPGWKVRSSMNRISILRRVFEAGTFHVCSLRKYHWVIASSLLRMPFRICQCFR